MMVGLHHPADEALDRLAKHCKSFRERMSLLEVHALVVVVAADPHVVSKGVSQIFYTYLRLLDIQKPSGNFQVGL